MNQKIDGLEFIQADMCVFNANRLLDPYTIIHEFNEMELIQFYLIKNSGVEKLEIYQMSEGKLLDMLEDCPPKRKLWEIHYQLKS